MVHQCKSLDKLFSRGWRSGFTPLVRISCFARFARFAVLDILTEWNGILKEVSAYKKRKEQG